MDQQIAKLAQSDAEVRKELKRGINRGLKLVRSEVTPKIPSWSGRTVKGFRSKVRQAKGGLWWEGKFYNKNPFYLRLVQEGRKGGKAPYNLPERFTAWVAEKTGATGSELNKAVFGLLRSISVKGTSQAQGDIMGEAKNKLEPVIVKEFMNAMNRIVTLLEVRNGK